MDVTAITIQDASPHRRLDATGSVALPQDGNAESPVGEHATFPEPTGRKFPHPRPHEHQRGTFLLPRHLSEPTLPLPLQEQKGRILNTVKWKMVKQN
jgi:hypothetical protein